LGANHNQIFSKVNVSASLLFTLATLLSSSMLWANAFLLPFLRSFPFSLVFFICLLLVPSFLSKLQNVRHNLLDLVPNLVTISCLKNAHAVFWLHLHGSSWIAILSLSVGLYISFHAPAAPIHSAAS
jgi:hypothetical protein